MESIILKLKENYNILFWTLCILFALVHIDNYTGQSIGLSIYLIMVIPQFVAGALLAVVRIQKGILNSSFIHFFADSWIFILSIESKIPNHAWTKNFVDALLFSIFLLGLTQFNLCKRAIFILMSPSSRVFRVDLIPRAAPCENE